MSISPAVGDDSRRLLQLLVHAVQRAEFRIVNQGKHTAGETEIMCPSSHGMPVLWAGSREVASDAFCPPSLSERSTGQCSRPGQSRFCGVMLTSTTQRRLVGRGRREVFVTGRSSSTFGTDRRITFATLGQSQPFQHPTQHANEVGVGNVSVNLS